MFLDSPPLASVTDALLLARSRRETKVIALMGGSDFFSNGIHLNVIEAAARGAQPNTTLADASISMGGFPVALRDTRDYYQRDIRFIIAVTLIVVLVTLMLLLRAVIAIAVCFGAVIVLAVAARFASGCCAGEPMT